MAISRWWVGLVPVQSLIQKKLLGEDRNRQIRRSEDPGTGPWHVSGGGVSPEHIHHHRDKTLALVASMICIGTCSGNSRSPRIKFARHMFIIQADWVHLEFAEITLQQKVSARKLKPIRRVTSLANFRCQLPIGHAD